MKNKVLLLIALSLLLTECGQNSLEQSSLKSNITDGTPFMVDTSDVKTLIIAQSVKDFKLWESAFAQEEQNQKSFGITIKKIFRGIVDSNQVFIETEILDHDSAESYFNSETYKTSEAKALVNDDLKSYYLKNRYYYNETISDSFLMFMSFKVLKFDKWENAFLNDYKADSNYQFHVKSVYQGLINEDLVAMFFAVNDLNYTEKLAKNPAFRLKMLKAGVVSYPAIYKLRER